MDMQILYALEKLRTPFFDTVLGAITYLGEETLFMAIRIGLKRVFVAMFGDALFPNAIRYFCMMVFGALLWPMTFRWFAAMGKKK